MTQKKKAKIQKDINRLAGKVKNAKPKKPSVYIRFMFHMMAAQRKGDKNCISSETVYWKEHGWLDKQVPWGNL